MAQIKVIHLELEGEHYYFGSPKAMFDILGKEKLGMSYRSFHSNIHLKVGVPYHNRRRGYTIRVGILGQAKTNRNNRLKAMTQVAAPESAPMPVEKTVQPVAVDNATAKRKKKDKDVPEQLTLF